MLCYQLTAFIILVGFSIASEVEPIRVDLSAPTGRRDAETLAWHEWEIGEETEVSKQFADVRVTLRGLRTPLAGFLHKHALATGATLAADGITATGAIEISIAGLPAGSHSLITYHNWPQNGAEGGVTLAIGNAKSQAVPSREAEDNADIAAAFLEFEVAESETVTARLTAHGAQEDARLVLNGLAIGGGDPRKQAKRPAPANFDEHVDGERGCVKLSWTAADSAARHRVYLTHDRDWNVARRSLHEADTGSSSLMGETEDSSFRIDVPPNDSLEHYCWRVDTVDAAGKVTRGDVWSFRVRHLAFPGARVRTVCHRWSRRESDQSH